MNALSAAALLLASSLAPSDPAQSEPTQSDPAPQGASQREPVAPREMLAFRSWGTDALLRHPKDAALARAIGLVRSRIAELPGEVDGFPPIPPDLLTIAGLVLGGPLELRIDVLGEPPPGALAPVPLAASLRVEAASGGEASEIAGMLVGLLELFEVPTTAADPDGLRQVSGVPVPVWHGAQGSDFLVAAGVLPAGPADFSDLGLPEGVEPAMAMRFDYGAIIELMSLLGEMTGDPSLDELRTMFEGLGFDRFRLSWALGLGDRLVSISRAQGYASVMDDLGTLPSSRVTAETLSLVPSDAVWATVGVASWSAAFTQMLPLMSADLAEQGVDPFAEIERETGIHFVRDVTDHLGETFGMYTSDSTGGGGFLSAVAFVEVADAPALRETLVRFETLINGIAESEAEGYVRFARRDVGPASMTTLTFPGLPVPLEASYALGDRWLVVGLTPQAVEAALAQATGGGPGLFANPSFRAYAPEIGEGTLSVGFLDTPRLLAGGYGLASLLASSLANSVRSPVDPSREPGTILPPYAELAAGARPMVSTQTIEGEDVVASVEADPSILVNLTGTVGILGGSIVTLVMPAVLVPAVVSRMESADAERARQLRMQLEAERLRQEMEQRREELEGDGRGGD